VGPLGEHRESTVGKGGESIVESHHLQGCSPPSLSIKADGFVPTSKY
jgi:hypothetical protein